jgi:hypothetical protein
LAGALERQIAGAMTRVVEEREPANVRLAEEAYRVVKKMAALDRASKLTSEDRDRLATRLTS